MRTLLLALLLLLGLQTHAGESDVDGEVWMTQFRQILAKYNPRSIDQLLQHLPPELLARNILMFESHSLQKASYTHPRVILASPFAHFILAFNGAPDQDGYDSLETIRFTTKNGRPEFLFEAFHFADDMQERADYLAGHGLYSRLQSHADDAGVNPALCLSCHRQDPRPNWAQYPFWPGAYGQLDDNSSDANGSAEDPTTGETITVDNTEAVRQLPLFVRAATSMPRYRWLTHLDGHLSEQRFSLAILARFTSDLGQLNFQRVNYLLKQSSVYAQARARMLMIGFDCDTSSLPQNGAMPPSLFLTSLSSARVHHLLDVYQDELPIDDFFMNFDVGPGNAMTTPGNDEAEIAYVMVKDDATLKPLFNIEHDQASYEDTWRAWPQSNDTVCRTLLRQAK